MFQIIYKFHFIYSFFVNDMQRNNYIITDMHYEQNVIQCIVKARLNNVYVFQYIVNNIHYV